MRESAAMHMLDMPSTPGPQLPQRVYSACSGCAAGVQRMQRVYHGQGNMGERSFQQWPARGSPICDSPQLVRVPRNPDLLDPSFRAL